MSWREELKPASFRGVPFEVDGAERTGGRRTVLHEFPQRDDPFSEDLGRKARRFSVEAYVIGDNYLAARNALIKALEDVGPGELVHPYYGTKRVAVDGDFRVSESTRDGGQARFSITFVETPVKPSQPAAVIDAASKVTTAATAAKTSAVAAFISRYVTDGTRTDSIAGALRSATLKMDSALRKVSMATQEAAIMRNRIDRFRSSLVSLVTTPETLVEDLSEIVEAFTSPGTLLEVYSFDPGTSPLDTTPSRQQELTNFQQTQLLVQRLVVIQAATLAPSQTYDSFEGAVSAREAITDLLDELAEAATDDTFPDLLQLRSDLVKAVPGDDSDLAHLVSHTPRVTLPSLVLSHQLYGDVDHEADVIARNNIRHPGFVVGGTELEVLTDD